MLGFPSPGAAPAVVAGPAQVPGETGGVGLASDSEAAWRTQAVISLRRFGAEARDSVPVLLLQIDNAFLRAGGFGEFGVWDLKQEAVRTLGEIGPAAAAALPRLRATDAELEERRGDFIEERIAEVLIDGTAADRESALLALSKHRNWRVRRAAATEIGRQDPLPDRRAAVLVSMLADGSDYVRTTAAESLLERGRERQACHAALLKPAPDSEYTNAWTHVQIMWRYGLDPRAILPHLKADRDGAANPTVRQNLSHMIQEVEAGRWHKSGDW